ncbi:hypothetical protein DXG03_000592 [Asterophora parasitica]|uniref:Uncharacterized protein n=1 Tax=Asterophora parasitica TaxID=117018 RepID=A0A9P7G6D4_9AGAR|nr:hypothetical protein DXG03_000592 [Asterophora parasitica]
MYFDLGSVVHHVSVFQVEGLGWTALSLVSVALFFIYSLASVSRPVPPPALKKRPPNYLAQARQRQAEKAAIIRLEQSRTRIRESWANDGFPFLKFPPELQHAVLGFCADSPSTYLALVRVSHATYHSTLRACIPLMPITLSTSKQLSAFARLVHRDEENPRSLAPNNACLLVHHLWVSPLRREDTPTAYNILRACTNVRALACDARTLATSIAKRKFRHTMCRDLTLLLSQPQWEGTMDTPSGRLFLRQLTHLRVMGEPTVPRVLPMAELTHLSWSTVDDDGAAKPWPLGDRVVFPALQQVVLTRRCGPEKPEPRKISSQLALFYVLRDYTEMELWCEGVTGQSLWSRAAAAKAAPPAKKAALTA